jgi:hypothetical protein
MKLWTIATVVLSIVVSCGAAVLIARTSTVDPVQLIRTRSIELLDKDGKVRARLSVVKDGMDERPEVSLLTPEGRPSVLLTLNGRGEGTLYFSSPQTEGKVAVGYVWGSDVPPQSEEDLLGFWGLRVLGQSGLTEAVGIGNDGQPRLPER